MRTSKPPRKMRIARIDGLSVAEFMARQSNMANDPASSPQITAQSSEKGGTS